MGKQVIITRNRESGQRNVYRTLDEVSKVLGVSASTVSRAILECRDVAGAQVRYGDRVFAVKRKGESEWKVMVENARCTGYILYGEPSVKCGKRDTESVRDITASWYFSWDGTEFAGER